MTIGTDLGGMGGGLVPGLFPPPSSMRPVLVGERWAVVAGHPRVSQVAAHIFEQGGNAVDAGVAAGIASNVVQADMANFGGIAPILIRRPGESECYSIAGVGRWSRTATLEEMIARHSGGLPLDGAPAIVPGAPAAWLKALADFGSMSFAEVAKPAIEIAESGFILDKETATSLELMGRRFRQWQSSNAVYRPGDRPLSPGDRLRQPKLAELLARMVDAESRTKGTRIEKIRAAHEDFYTGEVAETITEWVTSHGGFMTTLDLREFEAEVEPATQIPFENWTLFSTPSWSQGPLTLEILGIYERTQGSLHELVEAITLAFNDREDYFAAPDRMSVDVSDLLDSGRLSELARKIGKLAMSGRSSHSVLSSGMTSTTAVVTMDSDGCSFAASPSDTLDGGPIIPELGIMCSPRGVQSRLDSQHPNALAPWGRPCVTPAAVIGLSDSRAWALACPGGDVIVQAIAQVIWNVIRGGLDIQQAVEEPRIAAFNAPSAFHPHPSADRLVFVEGRVSDVEVDNLKASGHDTRVWPDYEFDAGSVQTIKQERNKDGESYLVTGADPRRSAYALAH